MAKKAPSTIHTKTNALQYIRTIYLSLGAIIGLICFVMGASGAIKLGLNIWFPVDNSIYYTPYQSPCEQPAVTQGSDGKIITTARTAAEIADCNAKTQESQDRQAKNDFNRQVSDSIALAIVGLPVWLFHFWLMQADWKKKKQS